MIDLLKRLFPIHRSILGPGIKKSLEIIAENVEIMKIKKIKSRTKVFDWIIPDEWHIHEAYMVTSEGKKICDIKKNNLHVMSYSCSVNKIISYQELRKKLIFNKKLPNSIPYATSYYKKNWSFCISYNQFKKLSKKGKYKVFINSNFVKGHLSYGEAYIKGKSKKEFFLSTYLCHPSMANNELSGPVVMSKLIKNIMKKKNFFSYRFVIVPETIGSIAYISKNLNQMKKNIMHGINLSCIGDNRSYSFLPSRDEKYIINKIGKKVIMQKKNHKIYNWLDRGSDERQYCWPGVNLPIISIMRTKYGKYKEYHTSLDKIGNVVTLKGLEGGLKTVEEIINIIENNYYPKSKILCEPFMQKRNLYPDISTKNTPGDFRKLIDIMSYCDGSRSIFEISEIMKTDFFSILEKVKFLKKLKLVSLNM